MGWVMAGLGFHGLDMPKFIRPMTHPSSGPPQPSPFPARPIGLGQGSAMGWWAEPKPMRTIDLYIQHRGENSHHARSGRGMDLLEMELLCTEC